MQPVLEETIYVDFIVCSSTGAAADADSTPTAEVFEDATDTTVVALTVTKRTSKTGNYRVPIACTAANGFEAAKSYNVVASATVGGVATKAVVARFQMRTYSADNALRPTTAGRTLDVSAGGEAGLDWANIGSPTTTVAFTGTTVSAVTTVATTTTTGTVGTVNALAANVITAASIAASALNGKGDWSTYAGGDTSGTTTLLARLTSGRAGNLDNLDATVSSRLPTSSYTAPSTPPTAAQNAAATWDLTTSGHTTGGTFGAAMNAAGSAGDPMATVVPGSYVAGTAGYIIGNRIDTAISTRSTFAGGAVASVTAAVTVGTNSDKTGYVLAAAGLDAISVVDPGAPGSHTTFAKMMVAVYRALWKKNTMTATQAKRYANDGTTVNATAAVADDGTTQSLGDFS